MSECVSDRVKVSESEGGNTEKENNSRFESFAVRAPAAGSFVRARVHRPSPTSLVETSVSVRVDRADGPRRGSRSTILFVAFTFSLVTATIRRAYERFSKFPAVQLLPACSAESIEPRPLVVLLRISPGTAVIRRRL
jgi:hypothetical protein